MAYPVDLHEPRILTQFVLWFAHHQNRPSIGAEQTNSFRSNQRLHHLNSENQSPTRNTMADQIFIADGLDVDFSQRLDRTGRRSARVHRELGQTRNL